LTRQLCEAGQEVIAIVREPAMAQDLAQLGVSLHQGDVTEKESLRKPMTGVDGVFHVADWYKVGARDKSQAYAINVEGTRNVLKLMKELKIPKGVYTSTLAVNSDTHGVEADESYHFTGKHIAVTIKPKLMRTILP
jgi:nucleoside-diphosphate-sugar epimerase